MLGTCLLLSACSAGSALSNDVVNNGPLSALPATDVAVETNLQTALQQAQVSALGGQTPAMPAGAVSGPSSGPSVVSYAAPAAGMTVLAGYNDVSHDCLGIVSIAGSYSGPPVLGKSSSGTYDFTAANASASSCDSTVFASEPVPPPGWPSDDPSSGSWPVP